MQITREQISTKSWFNKKANNIPAEIFKAEGPNALDAFHDVLQSIWSKEAMSEDFQSALIAALYNNKGSNCGNYRGISLLSVMEMIFTHVLLNRLITETERGLPEAQVASDQGAAQWTWFCHQTGAGEVYWTEQGPLLCLYKSDKGV